ncbi:phosphopantothenate-cysteine ligase /phosphopantothenoylcysteine decarboxylase [Litorimonas taeanensis]|uniref:Coenzyme A biosynthesis bifunctional protein CoaBC n=1 Tax=Litorimonas taeanensis TaxID=568099 RepID=A0A420WM38_9PROT|nr:bifunctional phosphopantothenoylcysteine decarboxylase/phosphopantothenate--cysteine ligase CoaBC [Litorimonas taeanensis]RKQ72083.1 phosphopantothenate-cysteine ligase /phosphopantothenoylcysteine decarboxylase [Litorimonas taeanensis]
MTKRVLLIIGGGIAAYKSLFLIRVLAKRGIQSRVILTRGGREFVTPLSAGGLSGDKVYTDLWDLTDEAEMGHIELSRSADLVVVAPATANMLAKAAQGLASDLATTTLLATDKRVLFAPAMNVRMWEHPATQRNIQTLRKDGCLFVGPDSGAMACGEFGDGRMAEPEMIAEAIETALKGVTHIDGIKPDMPLAGKRVLVTAGPTREPLDPVRYLSNHSSGKQGFAIAKSMAELGADVTLVAGPVNLPSPLGVTRIDVETADEMLQATEAALPSDVFISVAAVADWRPAARADKKVKKAKLQGGLPPLELVENPDILKTLCQKTSDRPTLIIGFAAETNDVIEHAKAKRLRKGCDWIVANDVSGDVMGGDHNRMIIVTETGETEWPRLTKQESADKLAQSIADYFKA